MKSFTFYVVVLTLAVGLLYGYNTFVPKNLLTFLIGLPIYVSIILWVVRVFDKRQGMT